jgi:hypothetical protein
MLEIQCSLNHFFLNLLISFQRPGFFVCLFGPVSCTFLDSAVRTRARNPKPVRRGGLLDSSLSFPIPVTVRRGSWQAVSRRWRRLRRGLRPRPTDGPATIGGVRIWRAKLVREWGRWLGHIVTALPPSAATTSCRRTGGPPDGLIHYAEILPEILHRHLWR